MKKIIQTLAIKENIYFAGMLLARGGGGGSGGGGHGGGGGFGGGFGGSQASGKFDPVSLIIFVAIAIAVGIFIWYNKKRLQKNISDAQAEILLDKNLNWEQLKTEISATFYSFQEAWSNFDIDAMKNLLTEEYYKRMVLELGVLQNEKRADIMKDVSIQDIYIYPTNADAADPNRITAHFSARAKDTLFDQEKNEILFEDTDPFGESWHFVKSGGKWLLDLITQDTEDGGMLDPEIEAFAKENNFYYDPDFGWLMLPNKGVLFSKSSFGKSDINNHVIGYYRNKTVEFYSYIPKPNAANYLIAQAILPIKYENILIKKNKLIDIGGWGLKRIKLESNDFNAKFAVWAKPNDQVSSLELLTPNFMDKIYNLPFEVDIEIVGNFLYFYTTSNKVDYKQMLEILSWAFDEMKM